VNFREVNALGSILNHTYGQSVEKQPGSFKVIPKLVGENKMTITCMVVVNLLDRQHMQKEVEKTYRECKKACNERLKQIKSDFKNSVGRALKTKQTGTDDSVELINMSAYSPKGTALVRCVYEFEVK
tara:strand:- start:141 stop:521 length:381 start_codon:yes stop_codon:yes gene_type:complete